MNITHYMITESSTLPAAGDTGWVGITTPSQNISETGITYTLSSGDGTKHVYAWVKDDAGNVSAVNSNSHFDVMYDTELPVVTSFVNNTGSPTSTNPINITITGTDTVGITGWLVTETSAKPSAAAAGWNSVSPSQTSFSAASTYSLTASGTHTLYAWAKDAAGNVSAVNANSHFDVLFDSQLPQTTAFTCSSSSPTKNPVVSFNLKGTDNIGITGWLVTESNTKPLPGASWNPVSPAVLTIDINNTYTLTSPATSRNQTLYAWIRDAAGNVSDINGTSHFEVLYDVTPPVVTAFTLTSPNPTNNQTITFNLVANDPV